jgi:hypothetical protein
MEDIQNIIQQKSKITAPKKKQYFLKLFPFIIPVVLVVSILQFWVHLFYLPMWVYYIFGVYCIGLFFDLD